MGDLSKNFSSHEFVCPCCSGGNISEGIITVAEIIRHHEGDKPLKPGSGCRCREHNETVQKAANPLYTPYSSKSKHMDCIAGDFPSENPLTLFNFLDNLFPGTYGIGVYGWGVHVDTRKIKSRWDRRT